MFAKKCFLWAVWVSGFNKMQGKHPKFVSYLSCALLICRWLGLVTQTLQVCRQLIIESLIHSLILLIQSRSSSLSYFVIVLFCVIQMIDMIMSRSRCGLPWTQVWYCYLFEYDIIILFWIPGMLRSWFNYQNAFFVIHRPLRPDLLPLLLHCPMALLHLVVLITWQRYWLGWNWTDVHQVNFLSRYVKFILIFFNFFVLY